jgi:hypothetical protein
LTLSPLSVKLGQAYFDPLTSVLSPFARGEAE